MSRVYEARAGWRSGFIVQLDRDETARDVERPDRHTDRRGKREVAAARPKPPAERPGAERAAEAASQVHLRRGWDVYLSAPITNYGRSR